MLVQSDQHYLFTVADVAREYNTLRDGLTCLELCMSGVKMHMHLGQSAVYKDDSSSVVLLWFCLQFISREGRRATSSYSKNVK